MTTSEVIVMRELQLPEFNKNCTIDEQKALVFEKKCQYDIIFGSDFLSKTRIDINYSSKTMDWFENTLQLR